MFAGVQQSPQDELLWQSALAFDPLSDFSAKGNDELRLGLRPRHLISTIYPKDLGARRLEDIFVTHHPEFHYSIYSMSERFRRRWLPKAMPAEAALDRLTSEGPVAALLSEPRP